MPSVSSTPQLYIPNQDSPVSFAVVLRNPTGNLSNRFEGMSFYVVQAPINPAFSVCASRNSTVPGKPTSRVSVFSQILL